MAVKECPLPIGRTRRPAAAAAVSTAATSSADAGLHDLGAGALVAGPVAPARAVPGSAGASVTRASFALGTVLGLHSAAPDVRWSTTVGLTRRVTDRHAAP